MRTGIDETLAATHGVEEELLRGEATEVRVLHKAAALGAVVVLVEVRQSPEPEAVRDALALDVLLPHAGGHLRDVDEGSLRTGVDHPLDAVVLLQRLLRLLARVVTRRVEHVVNLALKGLLQRHACVAERGEWAAKEVGGGVKPHR